MVKKRQKNGEKRAISSKKNGKKGHFKEKNRQFWVKNSHF
jgi:hypothetical protein